MKFYGRTKEIDILRKIRNNSKGSAQFTVVTGRRRIGKTELIREAFGDSPYLYFFVARRTEKELCESFRNEIETKLGEFIPGEQVKFKDIFKWVLRTACTRPLTLVIDEFQDLRRCDPAIYSEMQREWDEYHNRAKINLIVCGSVNTMMNRIFRDDKEPLYGRETAFLKIAPFPTETLKEILADHTSAAVPDDLLALYALTGGIAKYVALLMDHGAITRDQMIEDMVSEGSLFIEEGKAGLIEEFGKDYGTYFSILSAIACGRTTRKDIENASVSATSADSSSGWRRTTRSSSVASPCSASPWPRISVTGFWTTSTCSGSASSPSTALRWNSAHSDSFARSSAATGTCSAASHSSVTSMPSSPELGATPDSAAGGTAEARTRSTSSPRTNLTAPRRSMR